MQFSIATSHLLKIKLVCTWLLISLLAMLGVKCDLKPDGAGSDTTPASGPLRVIASNPYFFTDGSGKAIYLVGSHTWGNFAMDHGMNDPPGAFDYDGYLDFLVSHNHNFFRGWVWELPYSKNGSAGPFRWAPFPWLRTGPGIATDGKPKFDLDQFNQTYFNRIRSRVIAARDRGIYVSIMLFNGYSLQFNRTNSDGFPLDGRNNINGVDAGTSYAAHTLEIPVVTSRQEEYVKKVVDSVNDLDNVLFEISNESGLFATAWQYHMVNFIHLYEATKAKQHPVGMTFQYAGGSNAELISSPADWISPSDEDGYQTDPPESDGRKIVINDTDHSYPWTTLKTDGTAAQQRWVWMNFMRGNQVLFMDPYLTKYFPGRNNPTGNNTLEPSFGLTPDEYWDIIRDAMGRVRSYAGKVNIAQMTPQGSFSSTTYCLANIGVEYLIYQPFADTPFSVSIPPGIYWVEWYDPTRGVRLVAGTALGGANRSFIAPFSGDAVLHLRQ